MHPRRQNLPRRHVTCGSPVVTTAASEFASGASESTSLPDAGLRRPHQSLYGGTCQQTSGTPHRGSPPKLLPITTLATTAHYQHRTVQAYNARHYAQMARGTGLNTTAAESSAVPRRTGSDSNSRPMAGRPDLE